MPAKNLICVPPLVIIILDPFDIVYIIFRKVDYSGFNPGGFRRILISYRIIFCSAIIAQNRVCRKFLGSFIVSIMIVVIIGVKVI